MIDSISNIDLKNQGQKDVLGRVYEYFLSKFASAEGKSGGEFYTPQSIVQLLVEMLEPYKGRIYDPCCGSGGSLFNQKNLLKITVVVLAIYLYMVKNRILPLGVCVK